MPKPAEFPQSRDTTPPVEIEPKMNPDPSYVNLEESAPVADPEPAPLSSVTDPLLSLLAQKPQSQPEVVSPKVARPKPQPRVGNAVRGKPAVQKPPVFAPPVVSSPPAKADTQPEKTKPSKIFKGLDQSYEKLLLGFAAPPEATALHNPLNFFQNIHSEDQEGLSKLAFDNLTPFLPKLTESALDLDTATKLKGLKLTSQDLFFAQLYGNECNQIRCPFRAAVFEQPKLLKNGTAEFMKLPLGRLLLPGGADKKVRGFENPAYEKVLRGVQTDTANGFRRLTDHVQVSILFLERIIGELLVAANESMRISRLLLAFSPDKADNERYRSFQNLTVALFRIGNSYSQNLELFDYIRKALSADPQVAAQKVSDLKKRFLSRTNHFPLMLASTDQGSNYIPCSFILQNVEPEVSTKIGGCSRICRPSVSKASNNRNRGRKRKGKANNNSKQKRMMTTQSDAKPKNQPKSQMFCRYCKTLTDHLIENCPRRKSAEARKQKKSKKKKSAKPSL